MSLIMHMGANSVERKELSQVVLPMTTRSHQPISHDFFVNLVQDSLENVNLRVTEEAHGLTKDGGNYFGMFTVTGRDITTNDHSLVVGMRNSHVKKFGAGVVAGAKVFVCDNLSFSGEVKATRKHTTYILDELPALVAGSIAKVVDLSNFQTRRFEEYKRKELAPFEAEYMMVEMLRSGIMNGHRMPKLIEQWDNPDHLEFARTGHSAWRMFNAATEALKGTNVVDIQRKTTKLHELTDLVVELEAA